MRSSTVHWTEILGIEPGDIDSSEELSSDRTPAHMRPEPLHLRIDGSNSVQSNERIELRFEARTVRRPATDSTVRLPAHMRAEVVATDLEDVSTPVVGRHMRAEVGAPPVLKPIAFIPRATPRGHVEPRLPELRKFAPPVEPAADDLAPIVLRPITLTPRYTTPVIKPVIKLIPQSNEDTSQTPQVAANGGIIPDWSFDDVSLFISRQPKRRLPVAALVATVSLVLVLVQTQGFDHNNGSIANKLAASKSPSAQVVNKSAKAPAAVGVSTNPTTTLAPTTTAPPPPPPPPTTPPTTVFNPRDIIAPVTGGRLSSLFGMRVDPVTGRYALHAGEDFATPVGTPIHAANDGTVTQAGWESGYGYYTCIDHGAGFSTCYGHQSKIQVKVGQHVTKGQQIGLSGNTGQSTGPHVHFETRINGTPQNPANYLPK